MARILITNFHPIAGGGHVTYIETLTKIQDRSSHIIAVASPSLSRVYEYLNNSNYPNLYNQDFPAKIQKELPAIIKSAAHFNRIVSDFKPDIVHTNGVDLFIAAITNQPTHRYKIVRTHHAIKNIAADPYHRWLYNKAVSSNIYVSKQSLEISTQNGLHPKNSTVIENGVDIEFYKPRVKDPTLSQELGINESVFCFGSTAGTANYKRVDLAIEAGLALKKISTKEFRIIVLGNEAEGRKLETQAREAGLNEFVFCGFHKDTRRYISLFDAGFILSDSIETISYSAREMMAMGKPLISSSFSGLTSNVINGKNGFLVPPNNVDETILAMKNILSMDKEKLHEFSSNARTFATLNFNINTQLDDHSNLYSELMPPQR